MYSTAVSFKAFVFWTETSYPLPLFTNIPAQRIPPITTEIRLASPILQSSEIRYTNITIGRRMFAENSGMICARVVSMESTRSTIMFLYVPLLSESTEPNGIFESFSQSCLLTVPKTLNVPICDKDVDME